jgi:lysophospholipid acyltransferase (LPLAT)-like uncharacterized protein
VVFFWIYFLTLRKKIIYSESFKKELDKKTSFLVAFYHRDIFSVLYFVRIFKVLNMASAGRDGQIITQFLEFFGSRTVRGSARNNSVQALKAFIRELKNDVFCASIAVDGPKGPQLVPKPGILEISRIVQKPVFSVGVSYSSFWVLKKTWDQSRIPKPFSRIVFYFDTAHETLSKDENPRDPKLLESLENALSTNYKKALGILE